MIWLYERLQALQFTWRDAVDILLVAFVLYSILHLIRGTRAMQMTIGLLVLAGAYFGSRWAGLIALEALFREVLFYMPFAVIVLFQHEIRQALANFGRNPLLALFMRRAVNPQIDSIVRAAEELARRHYGALMVIERTQSLRTYVEGGKPLDAILSAELLLNIFTPNSPLHDGAVIIQSKRIAAAGCLLPLSSTAEFKRNYGTRHRAGLGMSEETDAVVVIVSEENQSLAVAVGGVLHENLTSAALTSLLGTEVIGERRMAS